VANSNIITKVYFPKILVPLSTLMVSCVDFLISLIIVLLLQFFMVGLPSLFFLLLPLVVLWALMFSLAFGLWLAALNVKYRDIKFVLPFFIQLGFYVSPVFLSTKFFMQLDVPGWLKFAFNLNPLVGILDSFRFLFTGEWFIYSVPAFAGSILITIAMMIFGLRYFYRFEKNFADYI
jgi:lipopolysaccharide transport system permease protein